MSVVYFLGIQLCALIFDLLPLYFKNSSLLAGFFNSITSLFNSKTFVVLFIFAFSVTFTVKLLFSQKFLENVITENSVKHNNIIFFSCHRFKRKTQNTKDKNVLINKA